MIIYFSNIFDYSCLNIWQKYKIKSNTYASTTTFGKHIKYFVTGFDNAFRFN
jgi:hypothetical protein